MEKCCREVLCFLSVFSVRFLSVFSVCFFSLCVFSSFTASVMLKRSPSSKVYRVPSSAIELLQRSCGGCLRGWARLLLPWDEMVMLLRPRVTMTTLKDGKERQSVVIFSAREITVY